MAVNLVYGGTTLPMPAVDGVKLDRADWLGRQVRMADGSLRTDFVAEKRTVGITWVDLTASEYTTLTSALTANRTSAVTLTLPNNVALTVLPKLGSFTESQYYDYAGNPLYSIQMTFVES